MLGQGERVLATGEQAGRQDRQPSVVFGSRKAQSLLGDPQDHRRIVVIEPRKIPRKMLPRHDIRIRAPGVQVGVAIGDGRAQFSRRVVQLEQLPSHLGAQCGIGQRCVRVRRLFHGALYNCFTQTKTTTAHACGSTSSTAEPSALLFREPLPVS
ncbi:MAG: hypothetical protein EOM91_16755 [Sphingobacteriia bacterium]|nr:hypothetical protein [Sphingobacteriia bacterium]